MDLAIGLGRDRLEELVEPFELRREARRLLVDEERAVRRHPGHQERHPETEKIHLGEEFLPHDRGDDAHLRVVDVLLLRGRRDANDLHRARRQIEADRGARAAKQHWLQLLAELVELVEADERALFVRVSGGDAGKPERRPELVRIDEGDDGVQVVDPVLERRAS